MAKTAKDKAEATDPNIVEETARAQAEAETVSRKAWQSLVSKAVQGYGSFRVTLNNLATLVIPAVQGSLKELFGSKAHDKAIEIVVALAEAEKADSETVEAIKKGIRYRLLAAGEKELVRIETAIEAGKKPKANPFDGTGTDTKAAARVKAAGTRAKKAADKEATKGKPSADAQVTDATMTTFDLLRIADRAGAFVAELVGRLNTADDAPDSAVLVYCGALIQDVTTLAIRLGELGVTFKNGKPVAKKAEKASA